MLFHCWGLLDILNLKDSHRGKTFPLRRFIKLQDNM